MQPERMIDEDDRIGGGEPLFDARPWPETINDPTLGSEHSIMPCSDLIVGSLHPSRAPLNLVHRVMRQIIGRAQSTTKRGL